MAADIGRGVRPFVLAVHILDGFGPASVAAAAPEPVAELLPASAAHIV